MEYFEDLTVGDTREFGAYEVTREEITSFAGRYDPQPFHTDEDAAEESMFGGLVASGWHTAAMTMRLLVEHQLSGSGAMGALGVDSLRWPTPVYPGDTLSVRTEVAERDVWDEDRGRVAIEVTTTTQADQTVLSMIGQVLWRRR
ncbi:MaoC family dehydratase [Haloarcula pellucida]|uniref:Acyl dehydratase n=1 Tax=Haloarcula pellucida TaxID=1427151 RepID=A0A830GHF2_9EURY|nr:MaoC family dehydratase [Halomicroarcula pellucida]MBX0347078.1 MaoC family dehydratase [Halomicroarcula pellucida]GGN86882.1 acyl dehydratase [Halomicroarcula pellucida]